MASLCCALIFFVPSLGEGDPEFLLAGRKLAMLSTAHGPIEGNMDLMDQAFERYAEYMHCENAGELLVERCTKPEELNQTIEEEARLFAREIVSPPLAQ